MLLILPYLDIFYTCFQDPHSNDGRRAMRILFNEKNKVLVSKNYITKLEEKFENKDFFQALIRELYDSGRLESRNVSIVENSLDNEYIQLANIDKIPLLIPIALKNNQVLKENVPHFYSYQSSKKPNRDWINFEIVSNSGFVVSFLDFKDNHQIEIFFENVFSIPRYFREVFVFDREQNCDKKLILKGKNVKYYTLFIGKSSFEKQQILRDLRRNLGGSLKLWSTKNKTLIHERKIIFENFVMTCDNSFCNISCHEPTWEINVYFSSEVATKWLEKCIRFAPVT